MNERIKLLAEQAKLPSYVLEYGTELCLAPHLEKFAELIVRECAELCLKHETMIYRDSMDYATLLRRLFQLRKGSHINTIIKEHFGVEE